MKTITFQGTEEEIKNLNALIQYGDNALPKEVVKSLRDVWVERLGNFISEDDTYEAYDKLVEQESINGDVMADYVVLMWEPLESRYTVSQLLDEIT